ncbi:putative serine/threonine protein kinase (Kin4) [Aspergillus clavatus NRRL 1]|uniref:non-specific serine/threonine protein kinase n=1 Tax=Aspergillus clavatus (strain ATCC 1007 / CBS 513.65 / DSM 816 / NCTC 3887 / NRRL 1 / QM 1276 / 107) TaxID=344612 RepID=A1CNX8_ASPCL|nr:serine/threonine protein kinase (Kin4), putative [Aspergillus clavatus NRRL 1]EAW07349.1 serine/threonine protein kinase (Kin4), putative [Aspergillus clavatus NRRL 1]
MSSAAMQTVPQNTFAHSPVTYASPSHSISPSASQYHDAPQTDSNDLPRSTLQPPRSRNSPRAFMSSPLNPQQLSHRPIPIVSSAMSDSHQQPPPLSTHVSPALNPVAPSPAQSNNRSPVYADFQGGPPIPPRTSSTHQSHHGLSETSPSTDRASSSRRSKNKVDDRSAGHRERRGDETRTRRSAPQSSENPARGTSLKGTNQSHAESSRAAEPRSEETMETISSQGTLVKESSTVINQAAVSDPSVDIVREQARQTEASESPPPESARPSGLALVGSEGVDDGGRGGLRSRHDYNEDANKRKETTFGEYILGQTLGEGEFGKVKLGWKKDGSVQVAIKLIRRESLGSNPTRLPKIYREISILRDLHHPNIVRLHEMVETDRHIGIIMEYASGGELFDHILNNRYLKDNSARRLFAQLVSGVGYLHKKGIVHRDLKLENLLLDRNRNIIITDFGFANTFDPIDELGEEIEYNLTNKEFVKRLRLDKPNSKGVRRGDLMQTSCGSPCYAAPELVVSDSLYTGRKVDVWSCGVILYAMLAGYLPFDDDPANPDGDNINLLYKYIVSTPLTFPEYVTPHARDLLRRILVPDPRKRADLFEVARHSWLSEFSHVVSHITSSTTKVADIADTTVPPENHREAPVLARSASVREPPKAYQSSVPTVGGLVHHSGDISQEQSADRSSKTSRDTKRRTVQVEYVAPQSQTARGESPTAPDSPTARPFDAEAAPPAARPTSRDATTGAQPGAWLQIYPMEQSSKRAGEAKAPAGPVPPPPGHLPRSISDSTALTGTHTTIPFTQATRPATGASMASFNTGRLPSRGSYGQPVAPTVAATNAQGRLAQPKSKQYVISAPIPQDSSQSGALSIGRPSTQALPAKFNTTPRQEPPKGHKRSNTVSGFGEKLFGRSGSFFGGRGTQTAPRQKSGKKYPPTSMRDPFAGEEIRVSMDSRRSGQYGSRKMSDTGGENRPRRFSLLPASFSLKGFSSSRSQTPEEESQTNRSSDPRVQQRPSASIIRPRARATSHGTQDAMGVVADGPGDEVLAHEEPVNYQARIDQQFAELDGLQSGPYQPTSYSSASAEQVYPNNNNESHYAYQYANHSAPNYYDDYNNAQDPRPSMQASRPGRGPNVLQKNHKKFADAYEYERDPSHHSGSSGAARKVMDFFRRRAKSRATDDR